MKKVLIVFCSLVLLLLIPSTAFAKQYTSWSDYTMIDGFSINQKVKLMGMLQSSHLKVNSGLDNDFFIVVGNTRTGDVAVVSFGGFGKTATAYDNYLKIVGGAFCDLYTGTNIHLNGSDYTPQPDKTILIGDSFAYNVVIAWGGSSSTTFVNSVTNYYKSHSFDDTFGFLSNINFRFVLSEVLNGLPIVIGVVITLLSIRKAIKFTISSLRSA